MTIANSPFSAVHSTAPALPRKQAGAAVRVWLWSVAALVFLMVVVGGAVRLTESGLSITEWQPIAGVIPPLNPAAWQLEFDHYKAIPQYARLFPDMDLAKSRCATRRSPGCCPRRRHPVLLANVPPVVHDEIARAMSSAARVLLVSGVRSSDATLALARYRGLGFRITRSAESAGWGCWVLARR